MRLSLILSAAISALTISSAVAAENAPAAAAAAPAAGSALTVKAREWVRTADGAAVGRIDSVNKAKDGSPSDVGIIYGGRVIHIQVATLSAGPKGYVTSLTKSDVEKLK